VVGVGHQVVPLPGDGSERLDEEMPPHGISRIGWWPEHFEDGQSGGAEITLRVGRQGPGLEPIDLTRDGLNPVRMRSSEVIGCDDTAQFFDDVVGRLAAIEGLSTIPASRHGLRDTDP
jgi:hypothetical protein